MNTSENRREALDGFRTPNPTPNTQCETGGAEHPLIDDYAQDQVRIRSRMLVEQFHLPVDDQEDLQQDMLLELLKAGERFDPALASKHTFASRVLDRFCQHFTRQESTRNRNGWKSMTFSDVAPDFSPDDRVGCDGPLDLLIAADRRNEIRAAINALPHDLRQLAMAMMDDTDKTAIAETLGISRRTVYRHLDRLREAFVEMGIDEFLQASGTHLG